MQTATEIKSLLAIAALMLVANWAMAPDVPDLVAAQKKEVAVAKVESLADAKAAAHRKAVVMREAGLFEQSNALMYPCCQAHAPQ